MNIKEILERELINRYVQAPYPSSISCDVDVKRTPGTTDTQFASGNKRFRKTVTKQKKSVVFKWGKIVKVHDIYDEVVYVTLEDGKYTEVQQYQDIVNLREYKLKRIMNED